MTVDEAYETLIALFRVLYEYRLAGSRAGLRLLEGLRPGGKPLDPAQAAVLRLRLSHAYKMIMKAHQSAMRLRTDVPLAAQDGDDFSVGEVLANLVLSGVEPSSQTVFDRLRHMWVRAARVPGAALDDDLLDQMRRLTGFIAERVTAAANTLGLEYAIDEL